MNSNQVLGNALIGAAFQQFYKNIIIDVNDVDIIRYRYKRMTKQLNWDFYEINNQTKNSLYVGSYGRDTDVCVSDIDWLFILPTYLKNIYSNYIGNGQSALLQKVKQSLANTYPLTYCKADGQVIVIPFSDGIKFELVPCFENNDCSFSFADTNYGGSWKKTNPRPEIKAVKEMNDETFGKMKALSRMTRIWKDFWNVPMGGLLIDTLVYNFLGKHKLKSSKLNSDYQYLCRDFFEYLSKCNPDQNYWSALGSGQLVYRKGKFEYKAKQCYNIACEAIDYTSRGYIVSAKTKWRDIYGTKFPK